MMPNGNPTFVGSLELPTMKSFDAMEAPKTLTSSAFTSSPFGAFAAFNALTADEEAEPEVYNPNMTFFTCFESTSKASDMLKKIENHFKDMKANYEMDEKHYAIKVKISSLTGDVVLSCHIFKHPTEQRRIVVEFKRRQGHVVHFRTIFDNLLVKLDILVLPPSQSTITKGNESKQNATSTASTTSSTAKTATATTATSTTATTTVAANSNDSSTASTSVSVKAQASN